MTGMDVAKLVWEEVQKTVGAAWEKFTPAEKASAAKLVVLYVRAEIEERSGTDVTEEEGLILNAASMYGDIGLERLKDAARETAWRVIKIAAGSVLSFV